MKKIILKLHLLAICSLCYTGQSQVTFTGLKKDYTQSMDILLTYVNKNQVNTGILIDKITTFSNLHSFNSTEHNLSVRTHLVQAQKLKNKC